MTTSHNLKARKSAAVNHPAPITQLMQEWQNTLPLNFWEFSAFLYIESSQSFIVLSSRKTQ